MISNLSYIFSWTCTFFAFIKITMFSRWHFFFVSSCTLHCKYARVTRVALSLHPYGSIFGGITFSNNLFWILVHLISLLVNVSHDSIIVVDNILYLVIPYMPLLCPRYSWHCVLYYLWNVKLCCLQQLQFHFYYIFFSILSNYSLA